MATTTRTNGKRNGWGGRRAGAGRKRGSGALPKAERKEQVTAYLSPERREYLRLFLASGNPSEQLREMIDRCMEMWPGGPGTGGAMKRWPERVEAWRRYNMGEGPCPLGKSLEEVRAMNAAAV